MVASKEMGPPVSPGLRSWSIPGYSLETLQRASRLECANFNDKGGTNFSKVDYAFYTEAFN